jgi:hypothetical protein
MNMMIHICNFFVYLVVVVVTTKLSCSKAPLNKLYQASKLHKISDLFSILKSDHHHV